MRRRCSHNVSSGKIHSNQDKNARRHWTTSARPPLNEGSSRMAADAQFSMQDILAEIRANAEARRARGEVVKRESRKPKAPPMAFGRPVVRNLGRLRAEVMTAALSHNAVGAI